MKKVIILLLLTLCSCATVNINGLAVRKIKNYNTEITWVMIGGFIGYSVVVVCIKR